MSVQHTAELPVKAVRPRRKVSGGFELLSEHDLSLLRFHQTRSGVSTTRLLRGAKDKPKSLNGAIIDSWLNGKTASARPEHFAYVIRRWEALPDGARVPYTNEMKSVLEAEFLRTGLGPHLLLKRARNIPAGLSGTLIFSWLSVPHLKAVNEVYWQYVLNLLSSMPDASPRVEPPKLAGPSWNRPDHRPLSVEQLTNLRHHRARTDIGPARLLNGVMDKPLGLTSSMISGWLAGTTRSALPEHVEYVLARYSGWPS